MSFLELLFLALGLSMDAFAVSICKGLSSRDKKLSNNLITGLYFGVFQGLMPLIGYYLGSSFSSLISSVDHWVAFVLLAAIGGKMLWDSREESCTVVGDFGLRSMLPLALATSIDALAIGITLAFLQVNILPAVSLIGIVTFVISAVGVSLGGLFGDRFKSKAEIMGGVILIFIGTKILLEHLGIFAF